MIDDLERRIDGIQVELRSLSAWHTNVPLLITVPGITWVLVQTIAAEIANVDRFPSPTKRTGYIIRGHACTSPSARQTRAAIRAGR